MQANTARFESDLARVKGATKTLGTEGKAGADKLTGSIDDLLLRLTGGREVSQFAGRIGDLITKMTGLGTATTLATAAFAAFAVGNVIAGLSDVRKAFADAGREFSFFEALQNIRDLDGFLNKKQKEDDELEKIRLRRRGLLQDIARNSTIASVEIRGSAEAAALRSRPDATGELERQAIEVDRRIALARAKFDQEEAQRKIRETSKTAAETARAQEAVTSEFSARRTKIETEAAIALAKLADDVKDRQIAAQKEITAAIQDRIQAEASAAAAVADIQGRPGSGILIRSAAQIQAAREAADATIRESTRAAEKDASLWDNAFKIREQTERAFAAKSIEIETQRINATRALLAPAGGGGVGQVQQILDEAQKQFAAIDALRQLGVATELDAVDEKLRIQDSTIAKLAAVRDQFAGIQIVERLAQQAIENFGTTVQNSIGAANQAFLQLDLGATVAAAGFGFRSSRQEIEDWTAAVYGARNAVLAFDAALGQTSD